MLVRSAVSYSLRKTASHREVPQESAIREATAPGAPQDRSVRGLLAGLEVDARLLGMVAAVPIDASMHVIDIGAGTGLLGLALAPDVGVVLAVNDEHASGPSAGDLVTVPKWGSFEAVIEALEQSFATSRLDG